jgi:hypothetical protein
VSVVVRVALLVSLAHPVRHAQDQASWFAKMVNSWQTPIIERGSKEVLTPAVSGHGEDHTSASAHVETEQQTHQPTVLSTLHSYFCAEGLEIERRPHAQC